MCLKKRKQMGVDKYLLEGNKNYNYMQNLNTMSRRSVACQRLKF